jgi:hypothetical protein
MLLKYFINKFAPGMHLTMTSFAGFKKLVKQGTKVK